MGVSELIALLSLALAIIVFFMNGRKDTRNDAAKEARHEAKLDAISNGVTDIRVEMRTMKSDIADHGTRLATVEGSDKEAHRRIGELEKLFHQAHPPA